MVILVRGVRPDSQVYHNRETCELYWRYEFYRVDLNSDVADDHVLEPFLDPLMSSELSCVVFSKSVVYAIAFAFVEDEIMPDCVAFVKEEDKLRCVKLMDSTTPNPEGGEKVDCLKSVSCVDLKGENPQKWKTLPSPVTYCAGAVGGILNGKLYCLSCRHLNEAQYYDPRRNKWLQVRAAPPKSFHECNVNPKIIPDPDNNRFFVHVSHGGAPCPTIYAWHPDRSGFGENSWYSIVGYLPTRQWRKKTIHADKMFFFYSRKFRGLFEVLSYEDKIWLQVEWPTPPPIFSKACSVCYLGNQQLCVCVSLTIVEPFLGTHLFFYIYAYERTSHSSITFKHCCTRSFIAKHMMKTEEIVFLPGDVR